MLISSNIVTATVVDGLWVEFIICNCHTAENLLMWCNMGGRLQCWCLKYHISFLKRAYFTMNWQLSVDTQARRIWPSKSNLYHFCVSPDNKMTGRVVVLVEPFSNNQFIWTYFSFRGHNCHLIAKTWVHWLVPASSV